MSPPERVEHLEGGDETTLAEHLRRPVVLAGLLAAVLAVGLVTALTRPWEQAAPAPSAAPSDSSPGISVAVVSTGSTGTVIGAGRAGYGAARMELRVDLVQGDGGRVVGIVGPGVARSFASGPALAPSTSSIVRAGAVMECPQALKGGPLDFGLSVEVLVAGQATRIARPLPPADAQQWATLVAQACAAG